jgi:hypothetical protein
MIRAALAVCAFSLALSACETRPTYYWAHTSGVQNPSKLELDDTICDGVASGTVSAGNSYPARGGGFAAGMEAGRRDAQAAGDRDAVHRGCMAERGWVLRKR